MFQSAQPEQNQPQNVTQPDNSFNQGFEGVSLTPSTLDGVAGPQGVKLALNIPLLDYTAPDFDVKMDQALKTSGFFYLANHSIPQTLIAECDKLARDFFALPQEEKEKYSISLSEIEPRGARGYMRKYQEHLDRNTKADLKELLDLAKDEPGVKIPFRGPNLWPADPEFRRVINEYVEANLNLGKDLMRRMTAYCGAPEAFAGFSDPTHILRLVYYPQAPLEAGQRQLGAGAHTDDGFITILQQDGVGGLQIIGKKNEWLDVPPIPGTLIINIGDGMHKLNPEYRCNVHRVVNNAGEDRYSLPFFLHSNFDAELPILPDKTKTFKPGEMKYNKYLKTYKYY